MLSGYPGTHTIIPGSVCLKKWVPGHGYEYCLWKKSGYPFARGTRRGATLVCWLSAGRKRTHTCHKCGCCTRYVSWVLVIGYLNPHPSLHFVSKYVLYEKQQYRNPLCQHASTTAATAVLRCWAVRLLESVGVPSQGSIQRGL